MWQKMKMDENCWNPEEDSMDDTPNVHPLIWL